MTFIDLFCGIGGFTLASSYSGSEGEMRCVYAQDLDPVCRKIYGKNFEPIPETAIHDIRDSSSDCMPDHDFLFAGFPCQSFSVIGNRKGFEDPERGSLFYDIFHIVEEKRPKCIVLENVKNLITHCKGDTLRTILGCFTHYEYEVHYKVLNALDFHLPQNRERVFIVGIRKDLPQRFEWPQPFHTRPSLRTFLDDNPEPRLFVSDRIRQNRIERCSNPDEFETAIWHQNRAGYVTAHPHACALRADPSWNYQLVNGIRRLSVREMLRLQGFPEWFEMPEDVSYQAARRVIGNSVPVPVVAKVLYNLRRSIQ